MNTKGFKCARCGNCCSQEGYVFLNCSDVRVIADYMGLAEKKFKEVYTVTSNSRIRLKGDYNKGCPFLKQGECSIYKARPKQCRTFPFWLENIRNPDNWKETAGYCKGTAEYK